MLFRIVWPIAMLVLFFCTLTLVFARLPDTLSPWWSPVVFLAVAVPFGLFANLWGPLLFYRLRIGGRRRWARSSGYVAVAPDGPTRWMDDLRNLFPRPLRGRILSHLRGPDLELVDYSYLRRYTSSGVDHRGVDARDAVTIGVAELGRPHPLLDIRPRTFAVRTFEAFAGHMLQGEVSLLPGAPNLRTGDAGFDERFVTTSSDPDGTTLPPGLKDVLRDHPSARCHVRGSRLFVHLGSLLPSRRLAAMLELTRELKRELSATP